VGNPGLEEAIQQHCGQKPPQGKGRTYEPKEVTEMMGESRDVRPIE